MAEKKGEYIEFNDQEIVNKIKEQRVEGLNDAVSEIDMEEAKENRMTPEQIELEKQGNIQNTNRNKNKFISEMKSGLGAKIKANPTDVKIIKKEVTFVDKIKEFFKQF